MAYTIIITGASSGIGEQVAYDAANLGFSLALAARTQKDLDRVAEKIQLIFNEKNFTSATVSTHVLDVSQKAQWPVVLSDILEKHNNNINVLLNNAGVGSKGPVFELTEEDFDKTFNINVKGTLWGMQAIISYFKQQGVGHIINVSSCLGRTPLAEYYGSYNASKHALNSLTANARQSLVNEGYGGIVVSSFHPGLVATDFGLHNGTTDNRLLPDPQPVEEVATRIINQILEGKRVTEDEKQRVLTTPNAAYTDGVFPEENAILYDTYSRDEYKPRTVSYFSANDMGLWERNIIKLRNQAASKK